MTMNNLSPAWLTLLPSGRLLVETSVWSADLGRIADELKRVEEFTDVYHLDVSDGHFSPAILLFPDLVKRVRGLSSKPLHVHLMVADRILLPQIEQFAEAGADIITVHAENQNASESIDLIQKLGRVAGIALRVDTPVERMSPFLDRIGWLTLLGTAIGVKGQNLNESAYMRLREAQEVLKGRLKERRVVLAADGGIRENTVAGLRNAGAQTVVMGSLAFGAEDLAGRIKLIHSY